MIISHVLRSKPEMLFGTDLVVKSAKSRSDSLDRKLVGDRITVTSFANKSDKTSDGAARILWV